MAVLSNRAGVWRVVAKPPTVVDPEEPPPPPPPPPGFWKHPAMYATGQLSFVKDQLAAGRQPWATQYNHLVTRTVGSTSSSANAGRAYSSLAWTARPHAVVTRHSSGANAVGDADLIADGQAALIHALIYAYKGTRANALKTIEILNAWSGVITEIRYDRATSADGKLLAGWTGTLYARAADLVRALFTPAAGEAALNITRLGQKFRDVWLPKLLPGHSGGGANWVMSFCDSVMQIGVFLEDRPTFDWAVSHWRMWVPSIFYLPTDTPWQPQLAGFPITMPETTYDRADTTITTMRSVWWGLNSAPGQIPAGTAMESVRDTHHNAMGFAGVFNTAEVARQHGINLLAEQRTRVTTAMETNCNWIHQRWVQGIAHPSGWPKDGTLEGYATSTQRATWVGLLEEYKRQGVSLPQTQRLVTEYVMPSSFVVDLMIVGEKLTHYGTP